MRKNTIITLPIALFLFCMTSCENQSNINYDVMPEIGLPDFSDKKTFGIVLTAFNRPVYLQQTLESLKASDLQDAAVVIVDDASTDPTTIRMLNEFTLGDVPLFKLRHTKNSGTLSGLMHGFKLLAKNADYLLNIDSDVIMKPDWLNTLKLTYQALDDENIILTGFNTKNHPTINCDVLWCEKASIGGINFFMSSGFYETQFLGWYKNENRFAPEVWKLWDWTAVSQMKKSGFKIYATRPSVIQHIGFEGLNSDASNHDNVDIAEDF